MCIVLLTTAHTDYALVLIDNRDEFVLRPTSRPSWWRHPTSGRRVLSACDLERDERGTWLGISETGLLAVLTNFQEAGSEGDGQTIHGIRSRGGVVKAWLGEEADDGFEKALHRLVGDGQLEAVGGFSLLAGKLRRREMQMAVVSNRAKSVDEVAMLHPGRGQTWGLSNSLFDQGDEWTKVRTGKRLLREAVAQVGSEEELIERLFGVLDDNSFPATARGRGLQETVKLLRETIFVPSLGDERQRQAMDGELASPCPAAARANDDEAVLGFGRGLYGTQRQTVLLVNWAGGVTVVERALYDAEGGAIARGQGDVVWRFDIDGWDDGPGPAEREC